MLDYNNNCLVSNSVSSEPCSMVTALNSNLNGMHQSSCQNDHICKGSHSKKFYIGDTTEEDDDSKSMENIVYFPGQDWSIEDSDEDDVEPVLMTPTQQQEEWCCYAFERKSSDSKDNSNGDNHRSNTLRRCKTRYYHGLSGLVAND